MAYCRLGAAHLEDQSGPEVGVEVSREFEGGVLFKEDEVVSFLAILWKYGG